MVVESSVINRLREARDRGVEYVVRHQRADGAIGNPETDGLGPYYKALWAFATAGRIDEGNRLATWVAREVLTEDGDFAGPLRGKLFDYSYVYPNAWMIVGAHKLGRFDISRRGMEFLMLLHHETGGFRIQRDNEDAPQDLLNSSQAGNACLFTGHLQEAKSVGKFLRTVWEAQPNPEKELFFVYKAGQGLRTDFPAERQRMHSIRSDTTRQMYFNMGIAAAFLARLAMATGDASWAELGRNYLQIGFNTQDEMYETEQVGKALIAQQTDSGGWDNTGGFVNDAIRIEVTCEFIVLLDEMIGGLAARG